MINNLFGWLPLATAVVALFGVVALAYAVY
jgi:hypothetical protein